MTWTRPSKSSHAVVFLEMLVGRLLVGPTMDWQDAEGYIDAIMVLYQMMAMDDLEAKSLAWKTDGKGRPVGTLRSMFDKCRKNVVGDQSGWMEPMYNVHLVPKEVRPV